MEDFILETYRWNKNGRTVMEDVLILAIESSAQLGEHLPCKQGVKGSNPFISTGL